MYTPDESQVVTCGSDKKIASWDVYDASLIRDLEGSAAGSILGLDMSKDGKLLVSGGQDKMLKVTSPSNLSSHLIGRLHRVQSLPIIMYFEYESSI